MPLVTSTEMFKKAYDGGYAIGAFNVNNMEIVQGITEACQEEHAPVILQVSKGARAYANHTYLVKLVEAAVECCPDIPIVLHLDHGPDFETCKSCIDGGFTSVMIDASGKPFAENIEITKKVVEYAHDHGVGHEHHRAIHPGDAQALAGIAVNHRSIDLPFFQWFHGFLSSLNMNRVAGRAARPALRMCIFYNYSSHLSSSWRSCSAQRLRVLLSRPLERRMTSTRRWPSATNRS